MNVGEIKEKIKSDGFNIVGGEIRVWGEFWYIDESQVEKFANTYFDNINWNSDDFSPNSPRLTPKILHIYPGKQLSWQYHSRRAEHWRVLENEVGVIISDTDELGAMQTYYPDDYIFIKQGKRHRLLGLETDCLLAEIWQHSDKNNPSDEFDIFRLNI